jgi:hypothetical protein
MNDFTLYLQRATPAFSSHMTLKNFPLKNGSTSKHRKMLRSDAPYLVESHVAEDAT